VQARIYELEPRDMAIMFAQDIERRTKTLSVEGLGADELTSWVSSVFAGCKARVVEELQSTSGRETSERATTAM
jgi:hypothetical protein